MYENFGKTDMISYLKYNGHFKWMMCRFKIKFILNKSFLIRIYQITYIILVEPKIKMIP